MPKYPGVPRGTPGYPGVPWGTPGYPWVPRGTPGDPRTKGGQPAVLPVTERYQHVGCASRPDGKFTADVVPRCARIQGVAKQLQKHVLANKPIPTLTLSISAPSFSERLANSFIKDIRVANIAFAAYLVISAERTLIKITLSLVL